MYATGQMPYPPVSLDPTLECSEAGVNALFRIPVTSPVMGVVCLGIFLALDRIMVSLTLLPQAWARSKTELYPIYTPPYWALLLWNVFTGMSIVTVAASARSHLSIIFKTFHVITESSILTQVLWKHRIYSLSTIVIFFVTTVGGLVFTYPCTVVVRWAERAGLVFDSINFVVHLFVARQQPTNRVLRRTLFGFFLHALYLCTYLIVNDLGRYIDGFVLDDVQAASVRTGGMLLNLWATDVFVRLCRDALLPPAGKMTLAEWRAARPSTQRVLCHGRSKFSIEGEEEDDLSLVDLHRPRMTAYLQPPPKLKYRHTARRLPGTTDLQFFVGPLALDTKPLHGQIPSDTTMVYVESFFKRDAFGAMVAGACALVLWRSMM